MTIRKRRDSDGYMRGAGEASRDYVKFDRPAPHDDGKQIDRSAIIDQNAEVNGGASGKLIAPETPPRKISMFEGVIREKPPR
jgi:hypothetical protein